MKASLTNENGATLLYTAITLIFIAVMGSSVIGVSATDGEDTANAVDSAQAEYEALAGLEWAKWRWSRNEDPTTTASITLIPLSSESYGLSGLSFRTASMEEGTLGTLDNPSVSAGEPAPVVNLAPPVFDAGGQVVAIPVPKALAEGTFTVTYDPESGATTSVGVAGAAKATRRMDLPPSSECFEFYDGAGFILPTTVSGSMRDVRFHMLSETADGKDCMGRLIMTSVSLSWTGAQDGELVASWNVDEAEHYDSLSGSGSPQGGAASGTIIDIDSDVILEDLEDHEFDVIGLIHNSGAVWASPQTFTVTAYFADGGSVSHNYVYDADAIDDEDGDGIPDEYDDDDDGDGILDADEDLVVDGDPDDDDGDTFRPIDLTEIEICLDCDPPPPTGVEAKVSFNYTLKDNTRFDDGINPLLTDQDDGGRWPCEVCEGSVRMTFLDNADNAIYGAKCNIVDAAPTGGSGATSYEHVCEFHFDVAEISDIKKIKFAGRDGISIRITEFFVSFDHDDGSLSRESYDPDGVPCLYDTETGIVPGATTSSGAVDTGSMDYSFSNPKHMCDVEGFEYELSVTYTL